MKKLLIILTILIAIIAVVFYSMTAGGQVQKTELFTYVKLPDLEKKVESKENFVVYMYGQNCVYCKKFAPVLEGYLKENKYHIYKMEVEAYANRLVSEKELNRFQTLIEENFQGTPTIYVYENGKISDYIVGNQPKQELAKFVEKNNGTFIETTEKEMKN